MPHRINIIARQNGVGLDRDVQLISDALTEGGHEVTISHCRSIPPWKAWFPGRTRFDANLFIERIFPRWIGAASRNFVVPNQERFPRRHLRLLSKMDHVLCKTRHGLEVFSQHHRDARYTGFTSPDMRCIAQNRPEQATCLHLAGRSTLKGTETVLELWRRHPEWPTLTLIQCKENAPDSVPSNVNLRTDYLSHEELQLLLNQNLIHLCPSLSEGWGHYIVEAMSCGALVVTTDAPPMNELVTSDRGALVSFHKSEPRHLGTNFFVAPDALEKTLTNLFSSPPDELKVRAHRARGWYEKNEAEFAPRLRKVVEEALSK